jgi:hypothetical protein
MDPFLKNKISSSLGFETRPSSNLDLLPELELAVLTCPSWYQWFFWGQIFATWQKKKGEV